MRQLLCMALLFTAILTRGPAAADPLSTASFIANGYTDTATGIGHACVLFTFNDDPRTVGTTTFNFGNPDPSNPYYVDTVFCTVRWTPFFGQPDRLKSLRRSGEEERWRSASSTVESSRRG